MTITTPDKQVPNLFWQKTASKHLELEILSYKASTFLTEQLTLSSKGSNPGRAVAVDV